MLIPTQKERQNDLKPSFKTKPIRQNVNSRNKVLQKLCHFCKFI